MASPTALGSVLVLGGCGFLGHHLVQKLLEADDVSHVTVFDVNISSQRREGARYIAGSINSREDLMNALQEAKPQVVFHTISPPAIGAETLFHKVNVDGTRLLLQCVQECGFVKALVYTSSSSVVHDNHSDLVNVTEELPLLFAPQQIWFYSHTKALAEEMILKANNVGGVLTCSIRPAGLFGEGDRTTTGNMISSAKEPNRGQFETLRLELCRQQRRCATPSCASAAPQSYSTSTRQSQSRWRGLRHNQRRSMAFLGLLSCYGYCGGLSHQEGERSCYSH
jgi:sterol-4alpha-carboxylate 3-dehydrogenase (decarboxylating)